MDHRPRSRFGLQEGDRLISIGPEEGEEELAALTRAPVPPTGSRRSLFHLWG